MKSLIQEHATSIGNARPAWSRNADPRHGGRTDGLSQQAQAGKMEQSLATRLEFDQLAPPQGEGASTERVVGQQEEARIDRTSEHSRPRSQRRG